MIIDDEHEVAFVHIPKCGGTSVRSQLASIDSYAGTFYDRKPHDRLGVLDYAHIPLAFMASDFPVEFEKLTRYRSFALVRDPHSRFVSATFERMALFGGVPRTAATAATALKAAEEAMGWLESRKGPFSDPAYIHFVRQSDYIALDGRTIVDHVHALEDLAGFGDALHEITGVEFDPDRRENPNFASPNPVLAILHQAKPVYSRLTSWKQRERILKLMRRWKLRSPDAFYSEFRDTPKIRAFVESYYAEDFDLHAAARARMARSRAAVAAPRPPMRPAVGANPA